MVTAIITLGATANRGGRVRVIERRITNEKRGFLAIRWGGRRPNF